MLQRFDIINGHFNCASLADCLISGFLLLFVAGFDVASGSLFGGLHLCILHRNQAFNFLKSIVDPIPTTLLGKFVVCTFRAQILS